MMSNSLSGAAHMVARALGWLCVVPIVAHAEAKSAAIGTWLGTEVVTHARGLVPRVESLVHIQAGERIDLSDPRLAQACGRVRAEYPEFPVHCNAILQGGNQYLYVVQIVTMASVHSAAKPCSQGVTLPRTLADIAESMRNDALLALSLTDQHAAEEFVNAEHTLDYRSPERHAKAREYYHRLKGQGDTLAKTMASCDPQQRADALVLMNFLGDPATMHGAALAAFDDPDEKVRNNGARLISTFIDDFNANEKRSLAVAACRRLEEENFFDQNKSLAILLALAREGTLAHSNVEPDCKRRIGQLARQSIADQISGFAHHILRIIDN